LDLKTWCWGDIYIYSDCVRVIESCVWLLRVLMTYRLIYFKLAIYINKSTCDYAIIYLFIRIKFIINLYIWLEV
jgi:hypothetical protein